MRKGIIYVYFNKAKYEKEGVEKYYVGQTIGTMEERARKDGRGYGWNDLNYNSKFARSIRKWGWNSFEGRVLEEVDEEDLNELEKFYIEYFDSFKNGYNSTLGGEGTRGLNPYANKTEKEMKEIKEKLSKSQSIVQRKLWEDKEYRKKQSIAKRKCWKNKEYKEKQSIVQRKHWKNKELREKISKIQRKRLKDPKEREKITGEKNGRAKSVYCDELNIIFSYVGLAEKYCVNVLNIKIGPIRDVCNGKRKSTGRYNGTKLTWNWTKNLDKETLNNTEYIDDKCYEEIINGNKKYLENPEIKKIQNKKLLCEKNGNAKSVYCDTLNIIFSYVGLAEKYCKNVLNSKISRIGSACDGKIKYSGKYNGTKLTWNWTKNLDKETLNNAEYIDSKCYEEIINGNKKYLENPEIKKIQNEKLLCEKHSNAKSVYCDTLNIIFSCVGLAEKYCKNILNSKIGPIRYTCDGKRKSSGKLADGTKLTWSWIENIDKETLDNAEYIDSKKYEEIINAK